MRKLHALLRQLPRLDKLNNDKDKKKSAQRGDDEEESSSSTLSFSTGQVVRQAELQELCQHLQKESSQNSLFKLELHGCEFEEGALVTLEDLVHNHTILQSLSLTSKTMSLGDITPLVARASTCLDAFSVEVRNGHIMTLIEKTNNTDDEDNNHNHNKEEANTVLLPQRTGRGVEATISSLHYGEPQQLDTMFVQELDALLRQCRWVTAMSVGPCSLNKTNFELLSRALTESHHLTRLLLSLQEPFQEGGLSPPGEARQLLTHLLESLPPSLQRMELFLNGIPGLLSSAPLSHHDEIPVQRFYDTLQHCPLDILELDHVGLHNDQESFLQLLEAVPRLRAPEAHLWVHDQGYFGDKALQALCQSLPHMNNFYTLSFIDDGPQHAQHPSEQQEEEWSRALMEAFHLNTGLRYVNVEVGSTFYPCGSSHDDDWQRLFGIWKRNEWLAMTQELLDDNNHLAEIPHHQALWPHLVETLGQSPESGIDSIHRVVQCHLTQLGLGRP